MRICTSITLSIVAAILLGGCNGNLEDRNALLMDANADLREQAEQQERALETMYGELRDKDAQLLSLRQQMDAMSAQPPNAFGSIEGVEGKYSAGEMTAVIGNDLLFAPGKATLRASAKQTLAEVARTIRREYPGNNIRVSGHTDRDPIRKSGYKSNYHLGFERAYAVREYLISQGLDAEQLAIVSYGPDRARETKERSRRVEITVILDDRLS